MKANILKTNRKLLVLFIIFFVIFSLTGCSMTSNPWRKSVPKADISFQSEMWGPFVLNFIQADGSNHQIVDIDGNFIKPFWSSDGTTIFGLSNPAGQPPYEFIGYPAYWNIKNGTFKRCDENLPYYGQIEEYVDSGNKEEVLLYNISEIVIFDFDTCKKIKVLVDLTEQTGDYAISGFSYFPETKDLLYGRYSVPINDRKYRLIKLNLQTNKQDEVAEGINPAWSPDGKQIAYLGMDGLYINRADGQQPKQLINRQFFNPDDIGGPALDAPEPFWSPDGVWLVYHQCIDKLCDVKQTPIFRVRVSDGMEVKIFTGGKFPSWRP